MGHVTLIALVFMAAAVSAQTTPPITAQSLQQIAASLQMYVDMLPQIPKIYGYSVNIANVLTIPLTIGMYAKTWKFHRDLPPTPVFVYGTNQATATFPGPTIMARQGVPLSIRWENHLPQNHILPWDPKIPTAIPKNSGVPTVVHLHGSAHPPASDGNPFAWFTANFAEKGPAWSQTTYTYPNIQPPGNLWYHDHALGLTRENLLAGLLGSYVIYKPIIDDPFNLPTGPEFDRHLTIVDRSFNADGTLYMNSTGTYPQLHPQWQPEYFGEAMIVNGKAWPFLNVFRRKYRFRVLNACNARYLRLSFSNGLSFKIIGSDASYLAAPVIAQTILLAPAEIADVVVDFSQCTTNSAELTNDAPYPFPTGAMPGSILGKIMKFNIFPMGTNPPDNSTVPAKVVPYATVTNDAILTRYLTLYEKFSPTGETTSLTINGLRLQDPATETPKTGTSELWNVINLTNDDHPFHIHLGMFQAINMQQLLDPIAFRSCMDVSNDAVRCNIATEAAGPIIPVPDHEKTWKNIIKIPPGAMTSIIVKFKIVDNNQTYPFDATVAPHYVYHCHILDHEDNEMVRPLQLVP